MLSFPLVELVLSGTVPSWMPLGTFGLTEAVELDSVEFMPRRKSKEGEQLFHIWASIHSLLSLVMSDSQRRGDCWILRSNIILRIFIKVLMASLYKR